MSHFAERFLSQRILKWHRHYCDYDSLNKKLKRIQFDENEEDEKEIIGEKKEEKNDFITENGKSEMEKDGNNIHHGSDEKDPLPSIPADTLSHSISPPPLSPPMPIPINIDESKSLNNSSFPPPPLQFSHSLNRFPSPSTSPPTSLSSSSSSSLLPVPKSATGSPKTKSPSSSSPSTPKKSSISAPTGSPSLTPQSSISFLPTEWPSISLSSASSMLTPSQWYAEVQKEMRKVSSFYTEKISNLIVVSINLTEQISKQFEHHESEIGNAFSGVRVDHDEMTNLSPNQLAAESLKSAFIDLYKQCVFLENFGAMNYAAFDHLFNKIKIYYPHSLHQNNNNINNPQSSTGSIQLTSRCKSLLNMFEFGLHTRLNDLKSSVESIVAKHFFDSNVTTARAILMSRAKPNLDWGMFNIGFHTGVMLLLIFWVLWDCVVDAEIRPPEVDIWLSAVLPIYRGIGCVILLIWCWGTLLYIWHRCKIHFLFLLDLDPRYTKTYSEIFSMASLLTIAFTGNFLLFFKTLRGDFPGWIPSGYFPMVLFIFMCFKLFPWPWNNVNPFSKIILRVVCAPFYTVTFVDSFIGDLLTSLVKVFIDISYTLCFAFKGYWRHELDKTFYNGCTNSDVYLLIIVPLVSAAPLWFRFLQCLRRYRDSGDRHPHLSNSGKYACSIIVVLFGAFHSYSNVGNVDFYAAMWLVFFFITTIYAATWDVLMDWSLLEWSEKNESNQNNMNNPRDILGDESSGNGMGKNGNGKSEIRSRKNSKKNKSILYDDNDNDHVSDEEEQGGGVEDSRIGNSDDEIDEIVGKSEGNFMTSQSRLLSPSHKKSQKGKEESHISSSTTSPPLTVSPLHSIASPLISSHQSKSFDANDISTSSSSQSAFHYHSMTDDSSSPPAIKMTNQSRNNSHSNVLSGAGHMRNSSSSPSSPIALSSSSSSSSYVHSPPPFHCMSICSLLFSYLSGYGLRSDRMIRRRWIYFICIIEDFILRFAWTLTLVPTSQEDSPFGSFWVYYVVPVLAIVEIIRRSIWAIFRVEFEHLQRSTEFIPNFVPLKANPPKLGGGLRTFLEIGGISLVVLAMALTAFFTR